MSVNTAVMPFTTSLDRLWENIHIQISSATFFKIYMSCLRLEDIMSCKNKYVKHAGSIWKSAHEHYKNVLLLAYLEHSLRTQGHDLVFPWLPEELPLTNRYHQRHNDP